MGTLANTLGSRALTRPSWRIVGSSAKEEADWQHVKLPVLQLWPDGGGLPQRGVVAAVTLPAKVMVAMKETRVLKSIVKMMRVVLKVLFV